MKVKKKTLEVFTVPANEVLGWFDYSFMPWEMKEVELTDYGIQFTFCLTKKSQEAQPAELAELRARLESATSALFDRARKGEITSTEAVELAKKEVDSSGIKVITLDEDYIFNLIHEMRFPSFWGSFFKPEYWAEPGAGRKITKAELTNDGVEFTMVEVRIP